MHREQFITELQGPVFSFDKDLVHTTAQILSWKTYGEKRDNSHAESSEMSRLYVAIDHPGTWPSNGFALTF